MTNLPSDQSANREDKMTKRKLKQDIHAILGRESLREVTAGLAALRSEDCLGPLFAALCSIDPLVHWHAVSAFGMVVRKLAEGNLETARVVMRRLLWSLNDESGGIGWGAPQAMAEIMANQPQLADEYLHMLISYTKEDGDGLFEDGNFIELPMLQRGLLWGIGRLCPIYGDRLRQAGVPADLVKYLASPDGVVRGMALWCLGRLAAEMPPTVAALQGDATLITLYDNGNFTAFSIDQLVALLGRESRLGTEEVLAEQAGPDGAEFGRYGK